MKAETWTVLTIAKESYARLFFLEAGSAGTFYTNSVLLRRPEDAGTAAMTQDLDRRHGCRLGRSS